jgi:hypothetical protein
MSVCEASDQGDTVNGYSRVNSFENSVGYVSDLFLILSTSQLFKRIAKTYDVVRLECGFCQVLARFRVQIFDELRLRGSGFFESGYKYEVGELMLHRK